MLDLATIVAARVSDARDTAERGSSIGVTVIALQNVVAMQHTGVVH